MLGTKVLGREDIQAIVRRLASEIEADLAGRSPIFIGVLKGCVYFLTDLTRLLRQPVEVDFIQVSSYGASTTTSGSVVLVKDITADVRNRDIYLVEDIVDTGTTLKDVIRLLEARHPRSIQVVSLLSKPSRRQVGWRSPSSAPRSTTCSWSAMDSTTPRATATCRTSTNWFSRPPAGKAREPWLPDRARMSPRSMGLGWSEVRELDRRCHECR